MSDFPETLVQPPFVSFGSLDSNSPMAVYAAIGGLSAGAAVWPSANFAIFMPAALEKPMLAQKIGVQVTTQSGNMDVGIYDERGTRLVSTGSTAVAAAGLQVFDITDTWLMPGTYFVAMCVDNTTAAFQRVTPSAAAFGRVCGLQQQNVGAVTLPATATFASYTLTYVPVVSVQCGAAL